LAVISGAVYYFAEVLVGNRVSREVEIEGLDIPEMGCAGYAGVVLDKQSETPMLKGDTLPSKKSTPSFVEA
jgi:hypothetical protein